MPNWNQILNEINAYAHGNTPDAPQAFDVVRRKYLLQFHQLTGRNVIAYYSGFLSKPDVQQADINDEDKNGFMQAVHGLDRSKGLDLFLHTPGGSIAATESIVNYLIKKFDGDIRAIVPQIAMSAGTMIACSCRSIVMADHSNLGPIDPQFRGISTAGVIEEFKRVYKEIKSDRGKIAVWQPILSKYMPTFLGQCENAIKWSRDFVQTNLAEQMFKGEKDAKKKASRITKDLLNYSKNRAHDRHIHLDECKSIGLKIQRLEDDDKLQEATLTVHHSYMCALMTLPCFKIIENHNGAAFIKQVPVLRKMP